MMSPRNLLLPLVVSVAMLGPGTALAVDDPAATSDSVPSAVDPATGTDSAPITLDQEAIDALTAQGEETDGDENVFEKASDFVTDNAPWFIIGIIVLAAIVAGILIMRGRPGRSGTPKASKSSKAMRQAGGTRGTDQPAQVPSAAELRRRKRAAIQRSREEERMRRKAGMQGRKAGRRDVPVDPATAAAAGGAAGAYAGQLDPVEAEKQGARDQEIAAGAVARYGAPAEAPPAGQPELQPTPGQAVPAPVSPSQTAPAAGVVTPPSGESAQLEQPAAPEHSGSPAAGEPEQATGGEYGYASDPPQEADTSVLHEPSLENPGADAAVGSAAQEFLAGGAAGAAGGFAAGRATRPEGEGVPDEGSLEPVVAPEPGMAAEHALVDDDAEPSAPSATEPADDAAAAAAEDRLRAKVEEIKAGQGPSPDEPKDEPEPPGADTDLSPGLAAVERRLSENSEERDRALREAEERLRRVEQRAEDAERRAAFAERLAQLKVEESEREKRLNDVVSGIDRAEQRAREAEQRAEAAERAAAAALERSDLHTREEPEPAPPEPHASRSFDEPEAHQEQPPAESTPAPPERKGLFGAGSGSAGHSSDSVNLNSATFEELREAGLSVTQATRILAYRERFGGYGSVEDLEKVPGFPEDLIESLKGRISV